jgi:hypothetical protein
MSVITIIPIDAMKFLIEELHEDKTLNCETQAKSAREALETAKKKIAPDKNVLIWKRRIFTRDHYQWEDSLLVAIFGNLAMNGKEEIKQEHFNHLKAVTR